MSIASYTYLLLNIGTLGSTLSLSFDRKVGFYRFWGALFPAIFVVGFFFIIWDILFTQWGIWHFSETYTLGWEFFGLPFEEWLFFFTVPYACVFTYQTLKFYVKKDILRSTAYPASWSLIVVSLTGAIVNYEKLYTSVTLSLLALILLLNILVIKPSYLGRFYLSYLVVFIPFLLVNGILTALPVVIYDNSENMAIRLGTIPIEDTVYGFILQLSNVNIFEFLLARKEKMVNRSTPVIQDQ